MSIRRKAIQPTRPIQAKLMAGVVIADDGRGQVEPADLEVRHHGRAGAPAAAAWDRPAPDRARTRPVQDIACNLLEEPKWLPRGQPAARRARARPIHSINFEPQRGAPEPAGQPGPEPERGRPTAGRGRADALVRREAWGEATVERDAEHRLDLGHGLAREQPVALADPLGDPHQVDAASGAAMVIVSGAIGLRRMSSRATRPIRSRTNFGLQARIGPSSPRAPGGTPSRSRQRAARARSPASDECRSVLIVYCPEWKFERRRRRSSPRE